MAATRELPTEFSRLITVDLSTDHCEDIRNGNKTKEGRLLQGIWVELRSGDYVLFGSRILVCVIDVNIYSSFESMLNTEGIKNILPRCKTIKNGIDIYQSMYGQAEGTNVVCIAFTRIL